MESNRAVRAWWCAIALFAAVVACAAQQVPYVTQQVPYVTQQVPYVAQQVPYAGVGAAFSVPKQPQQQPQPQQQQSDRNQFMMAVMYKMLYCNQKQCPGWKCQDDSAVIHGYCCGCPTSLFGHVAVPCVEDLKCPIKTRDLCDHYHFMTTCCC